MSPEDFADDGDDAGTFRARVRSFIACHAPAVPYRAGIRSAHDEAELELRRQWARRLYDEGLAGTDWPVEFGGCEIRSAERDIIVGEELAAVAAPGVPGAGELAAHALIEFGTDEQRRAHLPAIRDCRELWCQLFSEPEAGSDLASLRTRAVRDGGGYKITGQKVWTTDGHWADFGYLLARTDSDVPKHKGISAFILDMSSLGIDVRPLRELTGTSDFNEVFLEDVYVPAEAMIGSPGQGWVVANASLAHERSGVGAIVVKLRLAIDSLIECAAQCRIDGRSALENDLVRHRIGGLIADVEALAALSAANVDRWLRGASRAQDAPIAKLMFSEINLEMARFAVELAGEDGVLVEGDPAALQNGRWQDEWLYARAYTIAGGSSEIMRTLIAERGLALPRAAP
jgi:alkylation response protein AidB-like acyl-CoA dehydrogenase